MSSAKFDRVDRSVANPEEIGDRLQSFAGLNHAANLRDVIGFQLRFWMSRASRIARGAMTALVGVVGSRAEILEIRRPAAGTVPVFMSVIDLHIWRRTRSKESFRDNLVKEHLTAETSPS